VVQASGADTVIYTHPDCAYSAAAKMDFRRNKIAYVEVDISKETDKIPELLELSNGERVTPVIVNNGQVTIGFKGGY
jgi:glutaredoxin